MKKIPEGYFEPAEKQGKVVGFEYDTFHYAGARNPLRKKASVLFLSEKRRNSLRFSVGGNGSIIWQTLFCRTCLCIDRPAPRTAAF